MHLGEMKSLTEEICEKEIYPVSFFSRAFDLTNQMQDDLHRMEIAQIALFERQMKEHQAQILSVSRTDKQPEAYDPVPPPTPEPADEKNAMPPPYGNATRFPIPPPPVRESLLQPTRKPTIGKSENSLNERIEKKNLSDLRKAFTLNDRFHYCRELFGGDENVMNRTIAELNEKDSYNASVAYLKERFNWNFEDEIVAGFVFLLEKRFA